MSEDIKGCGCSDVLICNVHLIEKLKKELDAERELKLATEHQAERLQGRCDKQELQIHALTKERNEARLWVANLQDRTATHKCKICGALWVLNDPTKEQPDGSWSLASEKCGPCCDNAEMGEQIEAIGITAKLNEYTALYLKYKMQANELEAKYGLLRGAVGEIPDILEHALEWMEEDCGCDCGEDEIGTCALCRMKSLLESLKPHPTPAPDAPACSSSCLHYEHGPDGNCLKYVRGEYGACGNFKYGKADAPVNGCGTCDDMPYPAGHDLDSVATPKADPPVCEWVDHPDNPAWWLSSCGVPFAVKRKKCPKCGNPVLVKDVAREAAMKLRPPNRPPQGPGRPCS